MRSVVHRIVKFNRSFDHRSLKPKVDRMAASPFLFFRGAYHVFGRDIERGSFRKWPCLDSSGQIIGDLHVENFGTFRATNGEIAYDINDFDETTKAPYELDIRRLATSLVLKALDNGRSLGEGVIAAEHCVRAYIDFLRKHSELTTRDPFRELPERQDARKLMITAAAKSNSDLLAKTTQQPEPGLFRFKLGDHYLPVSDRERAQAEDAAPAMMSNCLAPEGVDPGKLKLIDVSFRIAGDGSLGRRRYALLFGKGNGTDTFDTLLLMEAKDSLDSALYATTPETSKGRAKSVLRATLAFQLTPKRYLSYAYWDDIPMQVRELDANDIRFDSAQFKDNDRFLHAAAIFGQITARAHLISTLGKIGPRSILTELGGEKEDRWVKRIVAFAVAYTDRTIDDHACFVGCKEEIAKAWS